MDSMGVPLRTLTEGGTYSGSGSGRDLSSCARNLHPCHALHPCHSLLGGGGGGGRGTPDSILRIVPAASSILALVAMRTIDFLRIISKVLKDSSSPPMPLVVAMPLVAAANDPFEEDSHCISLARVGRLTGVVRTTNGLRATVLYDGFA